MTSQLIYQGLEVSARAKEIADSIFESYDSKMFDASVRAILENIFNYDDMCLAGRLLIYEVVRAVPNVKTYLLLNESKLADHVVKFIRDNMKTLESMVKNAEYYNYDNHDHFSANTLNKTFLLKSSFNHKPTETPVLMHLRIAIALYHNSSGDEDSMYWVEQCFDQLNMCYYTPASPIIFNAGTKMEQMASCFLGAAPDDLPGLMRLWTIIGTISRCNGAFGFSLSDVRHSTISGTGQSSGILPFARTCDRVVEYIDQGGKRKGAATAFLNIWHIDVEDFIQSTDNGRSHEMRLRSLNTAIWMYNLFYERVANNEEWTLFCPKTAKGLSGLYNHEFEQKYLEYEALAVIRKQELEEAEARYLSLRQQLAEDPTLEDEYHKAHQVFEKATDNKIVFKKVMAAELMKLICDMQLKSGKPYVMNGDRCNYKSPHKSQGPINNSNLCTEIVEYSDSNNIASCNLHSMNLPKYVVREFNHSLSTPIGSTTNSDGETVTDEQIMRELAECYNFDLFGQIVSAVVRNLNKVIDKNLYPLDDMIKKPNMNSRPLGIGVQGLDDTFKLLDIIYTSREAVILNKMIFACLYYNAIKESVELAKIDGEYPLFRKGEYTRWDDHTKSFVKMQGSPMSNGQFQFDMWQEEYLMDKHYGRVRAPYDPRDNIPITPAQWSLKPRTVEIEIVPEVTVEKLEEASEVSEWSKRCNQSLKQSIWKRPFNYQPSKSCTDFNQQVWGSQKLVPRTVTFPAIIEEVAESWESLRYNMMKHGLRNSLFVAVMPTASTAQILRNAESVEAHQANFYTRQVLSGNYTIVNRHLYNDLKKIGLFNENVVQAIFNNRGSLLGLTDAIKKSPEKYLEDRASDFPSYEPRLRFLEEKYRGMYEIKMTYYLTMARQRGIYVDQTQSTNWHMIDPTLEARMACHAIAYNLKLKNCIYYLRNLVQTTDSGFNKTITSLQQERISSVKVLEEETDGPVCRMEEGCVSCSS